MNYWILAITFYLIAVLCIFAFIKGANAKPGKKIERDSTPVPDKKTNSSSPKHE